MFKLTNAGVGLLATLALLVLGSGVASATPHYYSELITTEDSLFLPSDTTIRRDSTTFGTLGDTINEGTVVGAGAGDGYLGYGSSLTIVHTFDPAADVDSIITASIGVGVIDDQRYDWFELAEIKLEGETWQLGLANAAIYGAIIDAGIIETDGQAVLTVIASFGDFNVVGSYMNVVYDDGAADGAGGSPGSVNATPEPGAMLLFSVGVGIVGATRRRSWGR